MAYLTAGVVGYGGGFVALFSGWRFLAKDLLEW